MGEYVIMADMKFIVNKWIWLCTALVVWTIVGLAVFGGKDAGSKPAKIYARPERIVCTAPNLVEILFALGAEGKLVGIPTDSKYPPGVDKIEKIGGFWQPSIEPIVAKKPDLVITLEFPQQKTLAKNLSTMGYNTLTINIETIDDLYAAIAKIGTVTYFEMEAKELIAGMQKDIAEFSQKMACEEKPKVLWVVQRNPLRIAGRDTFVNDMIELAGGVNAIGETLHQYPPIGSEQVYSTMPDVIIEPAMAGGDIGKQLPAAKEYWQKFDIPATTNKRIYVIDGDTVSQLGPRLFDGIQTIGKCIRPELFEER